MKSVATEIQNFSKFYWWVPFPLQLGKGSCWEANKSVKEDNKIILRAQEELNQILLDKIHNEGK